LWDATGGFLLVKDIIGTKPLSRFLDWKVIAKNWNIY
jgi:hypothetical protein